MKVTMVNRTFEEGGKADELQQWTLDSVRSAFNGTPHQLNIVYYDNVSQDDLRCDVLWVRSVGPNIYTANDLAVAAHRNGAIVTDTRVLNNRPCPATTKAEQYNLFLQNGIRVPHTVVVNLADIGAMSDDEWDVLKRSNAILKSSKGGRRGRTVWQLFNNSKPYMQKDGWMDDWAERIDPHDPYEVDILIQENIPNNGDIRVIVAGDQVAGAFKRGRKRNQYHMTASKGKSKPTNIGDSVRRMALEAARLIETEFASLDIVIDDRTKEPVLIEINEAPSWGNFYSITGINPVNNLIAYWQKSLSNG